MKAKTRLVFFCNDYSSALLESLKLDRELFTLSAAAAGPKYADILALSTRQAYGGIDLAIPNDSLDTYLGPAAAADNVNSSRSSFKDSSNALL
jgi:hypothetical protein